MKKKLKIMGKEYTAIIEESDNYFIGYLAEVTGANTQGKTLLEVKRNLKDALDLILSTS